MPVTYVCSTCGSDDVSRDALAAWSVPEQRWELQTELDNANCERCGDETRLIEVELHPPKRVVIQVHTTTTEVQE
jgi:DNA-directed RNA polymerase subunit RPC12/RpoP